MVDGSAEKLNFCLAPVGKERAMRERGGRWPARTYVAQIRQRIRGRRVKDREREGEERAETQIIVKPEKAGRARVRHRELAWEGRRGRK